MRIIGCRNCGSEKIFNKPCACCHDRDDEAEALYQAREAFSRGEIEVSELERRIEIALTDPPKPRRGITFQYG